MAEEIDKSLSEEDIKHRYIIPAIENSGWDKQHVRMEYPFTTGRVIFDGDVHAHKAPKRADYLLYGRILFYRRRFKVGLFHR